MFRLAEDHGIVLLNGSGFDAPDWSVRVSFANLDDDVYDDIGRGGARDRARLPSGLSDGDWQDRRQTSEATVGAPPPQGAKAAKA